MKDFNLLWLAVIGAPFYTLGLIRAMWFFAGSEWSAPGLAALVSTVFGVSLGVILCFVIAEGKTVTLNKLAGKK